jgi:hypothetical protein
MANHTSHSWWMKKIGIKGCGKWNEAWIKRWMRSELEWWLRRRTRCIHVSNMMVGDWQQDKVACITLQRLNSKEKKNNRCLHSHVHRDLQDVNQEAE